LRLHLVRHRTSLNNRIHATLLAFGHACPTSDLFGADGRALLARLALPAPWAGNVAASLALIDDPKAQLDACERELRRLGADHPDIGWLVTAPGDRLGGGLHHRRRDRRHRPVPLPRSGCAAPPGCGPGWSGPAAATTAGPLATNGPTWSGWALVEAATHAACHPVYRDHDQRTRARLGKQRGSKVARVEVARKLAEAI
jgi:transposase